MRRFVIIQVMLLIGVLFTNKANAVMIKIFSFPDLVAAASVIAEGKITLYQEQPILTVEKLLKGNAGNQLKLISRGIGTISPAEFADGERVIVFLEEPDQTGTVNLVGYSDQGKWPRLEGSVVYYKKTYNVTDLARLEYIINAVNYVFAGANFEEQGRRIVSMLKSDDELLQLAGLEFALSETLSNMLPQDQRGPAKRQLAAFSIDLLNSKNPDIRRWAIRLMSSAPTVVAAPALIPLIADTNEACRRQLKTELGRVFGESKIVIPVDLTALDTIEERQAAKDACETAWQANRDKRLEKDLPYLHRNLKSASQLEKDSARIYFNYLGITP